MRGNQLKQQANSRKWRVTEFSNFSFQDCCFLKSLALVISTLLFFMSGGCDSGDKSSSKGTVPKETKATLLYQLERKFENPDAHCKLGQLYSEEGQYAKAEYHFKTALEFDPVHRPTQAAMVKMFSSSADLAKAKLYADTYMKQAGNSVGQSLQLGQAFQAQGLDEYALACYQHALALNPDSPEANKQMGLYYLGKTDKVRAQEYLTRSFQANPNQPDVARELGRLGVVVEVPRLPGSSRPKSAEPSGQSPEGSGKAPAVKAQGK